MTRDLTQTAPSRTLGFWLALPMAVLQFVNAARAAADAQGFARYMGAPLEAAGDAAWVQIYALRTAFIALLVTALLIRRDLQALKWAAVVALVMPLGDAWIAQAHGAGLATVGRHLAIALYLAVTAIALSAGSRRRAE